jgi:hypothetical protein
MARWLNTIALMISFSARRSATLFPTRLEDLMPLPRRADDGFVLSALAIALLCLVLGGGAAVVAVDAVVSSYGSNDQAAVQTGPKNVIDPGTVISYGG